MTDLIPDMINSKSFQEKKVGNMKALGMYQAGAAGILKREEERDLVE
jgi:hypothetical protein